MRFSRYIFVFLMGFFIYSLVEIAGRGYTHWTMGITGGIVLAFLYIISSDPAIKLVKACMIGSVFITGLEFVVGIFDNIIMDWHVWDYSDIPLNILGQICPLFTLLWAILCIPAYYLCRAIRVRLN